MKLSLPQEVQITYPIYFSGKANIQKEEHTATLYQDFIHLASLSYSTLDSFVALSLKLRSIYSHFIWVLVTYFTWTEMK